MSFLNPDDIRSTWLNLSFPWLLPVKLKKLDGFAGVPNFRRGDLVGQEVIGQGTFGAVFEAKYQAEEKRAENGIVQKLLSTAQDSAARL